MEDKTTTSESVTSETEMTPTMSSIGIDNSSFELMVEKLDGMNYREWAQFIKLVDGKGKIGYLIGDTKQPTDAKI